MDLSLWMEIVEPDQDLAPLVENIETFLAGCADADDDGLSGPGEDELGTDAANPDSDDDGLCDGYASVKYVCINGEFFRDDFDADALANPLDDDDDGDGLSTRFEIAAEALAPNIDTDSIASYYDLDGDGDFILDKEEGSGDYDGDGIPAIVDQDDLPEECAADKPCTGGDGLHCNLDVGYCHPECHLAGRECSSGRICRRARCVIAATAPSDPDAGEGDPSELPDGAVAADGGDPGSTGGPKGSNGTSRGEDGGVDRDAGTGAAKTDGCSCRVAGAPSSDRPSPWLLGLASTLLVLRRVGVSRRSRRA